MTILDVVHEMDLTGLDNPQWISRKKMPRANQDFRAVQFRREVFLFAGKSINAGGTSTFLKMVDVYNVDTDTWRPEGT